MQQVPSFQIPTRPTFSQKINALKIKGLIMTTNALLASQKQSEQLAEMLRLCYRGRENNAFFNFNFYSTNIYSKKLSLKSNPALAVTF